MKNEKNQLPANPPLWNFAIHCYRLAGIPCETTSAGYTFYQLPSFTFIVPEGIAGVGSPFSFELPANLPLAAKIGAYLAAFDVLKTCQHYAMFLLIIVQKFCLLAHPPRKAGQSQNQKLTQNYRDLHFKSSLAAIWAPFSSPRGRAGDGVFLLTNNDTAEITSTSRLPHHQRSIDHARKT